MYPANARPYKEHGRIKKVPWVEPMVKKLKACKRIEECKKEKTVDEEWISFFSNKQEELDSKEELVGFDKIIYEFIPDLIESLFDLTDSLDKEIESLIPDSEFDITK